ncbi:Peptidase C14, caspase catalytic subunit p20 (plasmid) [Leisingera methylohalidivorans DSM 14336]|uniref:Peptidase C14, caspase catalytic subunit p20 n=2 Tax=Leisingera methylohalidivorans TaxID=133924 RepID=V9W1P4_9RHOB|nr:Peptidase C14, caspase catalytic subunit p20 [Leisingera methylohalidivorans DSM 14336]
MIWVRLMVLAVAAVCWGGRVLAEERLALVIGNSAYGAVQPLDNPVRDARLIAETLEGLGFDVTLAADARQIEMKRAIGQFGRKLRGAGEDATGLFYYAGHGVQSFGSNYLLPVDVALADAADLDLMAVEAQSVLRQMASARNRTNLVILDACRNNPFKDIADLNETGLAEMKAPTGTFLAYATAPGGVALDGEGENSPFTEALAREITVPGRPVEQVFKQVRRAVLDLSGGGQTPWDTSSLVSDFVFVPAEPEEVMSAAELQEAQFWQSVQASRDAMQIMLYLRGYGDGKYADEARGLLSELMAEELQGGAPVAAAPDAAAPAAESAPAAADAETAMFQAARDDGSKAAYEAYLMAYPEGRFAVIAAAEAAAMKAGGSQDPAAGGEAVAAAPQPDPAPPALAEAGPVTYASPIQSEMPQIAGLTLAEAVTRSPVFPPIEGLPESYWKDQSCSACHQWTRERLCTQGNTYLSLNMQRSLGKQHPFGGGLKQTLKSWAAGGCQ